MTRIVIWLALVAVAAPALADDAPPVHALRNPATTERHPIAPRASSSSGAASGGWWLGVAGVVLALGVSGGFCLASRKGGARDPLAGIAVVGRASLSPRHSVALVKVAGRTYLIGLGPQSAPALLGEWDDEPAAAAGGAA